MKALVCLFLLSPCSEIGATVIVSDPTTLLTFSPAPREGGDAKTELWSESNFQLTSEFMASRSGTNLTYLGGERFWPTNGTDHLSFLQNRDVQRTTITNILGSRFDAVSVDLAEYSQNFQQAKEVVFIGTTGNGSEVSTSFTLDGVIDGPGMNDDFQSFQFPSSFRNLQSLRSPSSIFAMDNLVLTTVPEPSGLFLTLGGSLLALGWRRRA